MLRTYSICRLSKYGLLNPICSGVTTFLLLNVGILKIIFVQKMAKRKKVIGKGAVVSSPAWMLHPSKAIRDCFINMNVKKRLDNMIDVMDQRNETINKKSWNASLFKVMR
jgi:hypothetical protein